MALCNYVYASGLRLRSGDAVVNLDGKLLRVVRDGNGRSRLDRIGGNPRTDGEITLRDLKDRLVSQGLSSIAVTVETADGSFSVELNPAAAMGRKGRQGDFKTALDAMPEEERVKAALYQLKTLPYQTASDRGESSARLAAALEYAPVGKAVRTLGPEFAQIADDALFAKMLASALPEDALRFGAARLDVELLELAADIAPTVALRLAAEHLSDQKLRQLLNRINASEVLDAKEGDKGLIVDMVKRFSEYSENHRALLASAYPAAVLKHASALLTDQQLELVASMAPLVALECVATRLSDVQFARFASSYASVAAAFAPERFSSEELTTIVCESKGYGLSQYGHRLSDEQLARAVALANPAHLLTIYNPLVDRLSDEQFDRAAKDAPLQALHYHADRLSDEQLDRAVTANPHAALEHAAHRLSDEQFDRVVEAAPYEALRKHADRLSDEQLDRIAATTEGWGVLSFASHRISAERFDQACVNSLHYAIEFAPDRLSDAHLTRAILEMPERTLQYAPQRLSHDQLDYLAQEHPMEAVRYARDLLSQEQLERSALANHYTIEFIAHRLSDEQFDRVVEAAPYEVLRSHAYRLSDEQFDRAVTAQPHAALRHHADRLSDEQFDRAVTASPEEALYYNADRLSDEQVARAVYATTSFNSLLLAAHRLSDEQFNTIARLEPLDSLEYTDRSSGVRLQEKHSTDSARDAVVKFITLARSKASALSA